MEQINTPNIVTIDLSGTIFKVRTSTLLRFPNSRLANLVNDNSTSNKTDFYFDQDATLFGHILRCCRSGEVHVPPMVCPREFLNELKFWKIPIEKISPCCWPAFYKADDIMESLETLNAVTSDPCDMTSDIHVSSFRRKLWLFLDNPNYSLGAKVFPHQPQREKTNFLTSAPNENSGRHARLCSLIRVFVVHIKNLCSLGYPKCAK